MSILLTMAGSLFGVLAKVFLGLFVKAHPAVTPEAAQAARAMQDHIDATINAKTAATQVAVAEAEVAAPQTKAEVVDTLDSGAF